ncbi:MFS transporter [Microbacterium sp. SORGH_AS_0888]|uniref:MFS transporter n=1 Tax=Microbacterium sp. SORGH_AS_0888 TaxID=3041791 RepID=UPI002783D048|nr:MFS transporter [Microbacterium sp. SORGH_AS_0888]MDQ1129467.1 MFS family permease [Microbacterium sp. SORGH_AS_0888]
MPQDDEQIVAAVIADAAPGPRARARTGPVPGEGIDPATLTSTVPVAGAARHRLVVSMLVANFFLFATYAGVIAILLPQQLAMLDEANKIANLAIVTGTSSLFTLFAQPIVGAFSDRTRSRLGRRSPWLLLGGLGGGVLTIVLQFAPGVFWITVVWVTAQMLLNAFQGPLSAIIADRIPRDGRATASAFAGAGTAIGGTIGVVVAGQLLAQLGVAYALLGAGVIVVTLLFVLVNRDRDSRALPIGPFRWGPFLRSFWVSPRRHPDYAWAFAGRFVMVLGYQGVQAYQFYILTDHLHLTPIDAGGVAGMLSLVSMVTLVIGTLVFGRLSDRLQRRKVFVFTASIVIALGVAIPLFVPTVPAMVVYSLIVGIGYGAYSAVDVALMVDVLPSQGDAGKDLGVLNVATNIPQALTPVVAATLLSLSGGNYAAIFGFAALMVLLSSVLVFPIRSVR